MLDRIVRYSTCMLLALSLPASARDSVTLCYEAQDVLPWRTEQGGGLNFALLKMVGQRLDIDFQFQSIPWKRCLAQLKANAVDGAFAVSYKADRREIGEYPGGNGADAGKRMHTDTYVLLRRKGSKVAWDGQHFSQLDGAVGFQLGYSVGDVLRAQNVEVDEGSQRAVELARKLIAGRVAAAAMGGSDAAGLMRGPLGAQLEQLPIPLIQKPYFLILSHALVASRPQLAERIWNEIEKSRNSPAYRKLEQAQGVRH
ncbi:MULTISPECIES: ABC transporter substrate-binding protein [unclassified Duganella]|uniref:substrate-binding periplasmic protein n=1 Tax=unclassified Duganella TaxID=2636909 RepID=UPI000880F9ED|nr:MULTISPECIES: transporter substrate-binding domain-containing protein [unclassified Duganella]SDG36061.1 polar amino acid transport system substrate-binding protein [Duganella sp. OV458]SDJ67375.1 polar amino acid transport system substrate-binding protein [Duganella sp. OV510]